MIRASPLTLGRELWLKAFDLDNDSSKGNEIDADRAIRL